MDPSSENLLQSAKLFAAEALYNAVQAHNGAEERWPLAVFHLVTSLEHAFKCRLAQVHPCFVRENLTKPDKTVGLEESIKRLVDPDIAALKLQERDQKRLIGVIKLRNSIAHGIYEQNPRALEAKFFETFALVQEFFWHQLETNVFDLVGRETSNTLKGNAIQIKELEKRAKSNLLVGEQGVYCPECEKDFMVFRNGTFECLFCHCEEAAIECDHCKKLQPGHMLLHTEDLYEWQFGGDRPYLLNDWGIEEKSVCENCYLVIEKKIAEKRKEAEIIEAQDDYYNWIIPE